MQGHATSVSVARGVTIDGTSLQQYAAGAIRSAAAFLPLAGHAHRTRRRCHDLVLARASTFLENMPHPGCRVFVLNVSSRRLALLGGLPPRRREPSRARRICGCAPGPCSPRPVTSVNKTFMPTKTDPQRLVRRSGFAHLARHQRVGGQQLARSLVLKVPSSMQILYGPGMAPA